MINSLIIHYHGNIKYSKEENNILISEEASWKDDFISKQLQIDYLKIEDYIKASQVVNQEFGEINNIDADTLLKLCTGSILIFGAMIIGQRLSGRKT